MNEEMGDLGAIEQDNNWAPDSWQTREAKQQANYPDEAELQASLVELAGLPPLVTSWEILSL